MAGGAGGEEKPAHKTAGGEKEDFSPSLNTAPATRAFKMSELPEGAPGRARRGGRRCRAGRAAPGSAAGSAAGGRGGARGSETVRLSPWVPLPFLFLSKYF